MSKIKIKKTGLVSEFGANWDNVSDVLNGEAGEVKVTFLQDGKTYYNANFPVYGGLFVGIPASVVEVVE